MKSPSEDRPPRRPHAGLARLADAGDRESDVPSFCSTSHVKFTSTFTCPFPSPHHMTYYDIALASRLRGVKRAEQVGLADELVE